MKNKIIRAATVPTSLQVFLAGSMGALMERYEVVLLASPGEELEAMRQACGCRVVAVPMKRQMSPLHDLLSLARLIRVFLREKPDMVHSMTPKAGLLCMLAAWLVRVPRRVHTFTGLIWPTASGLRRRILMATDWLTCACATHVVPEGQGVMDDLQAHISRKPMRLLGHGNVRGVDLDFWNVAQAPAALLERLRQPHRFTFLFVGRLVGDKGINELVEAFCLLVKRMPEARLLLVGGRESELDPLSPETLRRMETTPQIEEMGAVSSGDLRAFYAAADCLVHPSYREGFPNVVLEAGAMGLPAIVTDINGSREIIVHGKNGVIVPPRDASALYAAMERMCHEPEWRAALAAPARSMVAERYELSFVRKCLIDFYDEIM